MNSKRPNSGGADKRIELQPLAEGAASRWGKPPPAGVPEDQWAIPERPLHLCPTCDYNLTGLTAWCCPECGEPFTVCEARQRAIELSPSVRALRRSAQYRRILLVFGLVLLVVGLVLPFLSFTGRLVLPTIGLTRRGSTVLMLVSPVVGIGLLLKVYFQLEWLHFVLVAGFLAMCTGLAVSFM